MSVAASRKRPLFPAVIVSSITAIALAVIAVAISTGTSPRAGQPIPPSSSPSQADGTTFFDDFDDARPDPTKWAYDDEWGCCGLSKESDLMQGQGVSVADGVMTLVVERGSTPSGRDWRSAVITTRGLFAQRYGVFQARMKWDKGNGLWPAFWLLQSDAAGRRPEIDIMEAYPDIKDPGDASRYSVVNHYRDPGGTMDKQSMVIRTDVDLTADWHVYELEWRPTFMVVRFDGSEVGRFRSDIPSVPMFLVFDIVVGSPTSGSDASTPSPAHLSIDWVKVKE